MPGRPWHERLFRTLLRLFPAEFRERFAEDMAADFDDQRRDASAGHRAGSLRLWLATLPDLLMRASAEHTDTLRRDVRLAFRSCRRRPGLAMTVVATLAVTFSVAVTMFAVADGVLLRPLALPDSERIVRLFEVSPAPERQQRNVSGANFIDWAARARSVDDLALVGAFPMTVIADGNPEEVQAGHVSEGFFRMFPAVIAQGRGFLPEDFAPLLAHYASLPQGGTPLSPQVAVVSHGFWIRHLGGRPDAVGGSISVDGARVRVVGVLTVQPGFEEVPAWAPVEVWLADVPDPQHRRFRNRSVLGRITPGESTKTVQAEFDVIAAEIASAHPESNAGWGVQVSPLLDTVVADVRPQVWFLFAVSVCVLLVGAANVAGLLVARETSRAADQDTRLALGASRARLVRESITFGVMLAVLGGIVGLVLAVIGLPGVKALAPATLPRLDAVAFDARAGIAAVITMVTIGIACGLVSALLVRRMGGNTLRLTGADRVASRGRRIREGLVVAQTALAVLLAVAAGLMARSAYASGALDLGFDPRNVISVGYTMAFSHLGRKDDIQATLVSRTSIIDGVVAAGEGARPLSGGGFSNVVTPLDGPERDKEFRVAVDSVSARYFQALGARLVAGRFFDPGDAAGPRVSIVDEAAAAAFWPGGDAVGRSLRMDERISTVVGVVANIRRGALEEVPAPTLFVFNTQTPNMWTHNLLIRTAGDPSAVLPAIREIMRDVDPTQALTRVQLLEENVADARAPRVFLLRLVGVFSVIALGLAMLGVYGVMAEAVVTRAPEIGIRMALGATPRRIVRSVLSRCATLTVPGVVLGVAAAAALSDVIAGLVFGVDPRDPGTYVVAISALLAAVGVAAFLPARRAATISPAIVLKQR